MLPKPAVRKAPYAALAAKTGKACRTAALQAQRLCRKSQALRIKELQTCRPWTKTEASAAHVLRDFHQRLQCAAWPHTWSH